jgi:hypothetical protein
MGTVEIIALSMGAAWASGINLYAAVLTLGIMGATGNIELPPGLQILQDPMVIGAAGLMYCVEFFADKIPGVDNGWDAIHSFIRIPAGAILAAAAVGDVNPAMELAAAIAGGTLAGASHATKAGTRVIVNASPEPFSNWVVSLGEDVAVIAGLWTALHYPVVFVVLLALAILVMAIVLPKLWRGIKQIFRWLSENLGGGRTPAAAPEADTTALAQAAEAQEQATTRRGTVGSS